MSYGDTMRALRERMEWTQTELAEKARVNRTMIAQIESGGKVPSIMTAERIADAFGVTIDFMVKGEHNGE